MLAPSPLHVFRYTLNWQDALAYERLPRDLPGLQKITLYLWLGLAGIVLIALPAGIVGEINSIRFWLTGAGLVLLQYAIFVTLRGVTRFNRARYRYPVPADIALEQWPDHLVITSGGKTRQVRFEEIGALLPTAQRLFIASGHELIIVPLLAFEDGAGMAALVDAIDTYMRRKYEGDGKVDLIEPKA